MGRKTLNVPTKDMSGNRFGKWTLISVSGVKRYKNKRTLKSTIYWIYKCKCKCGSIREVGYPDLKQGRSTQCRDCHIKKNIRNSQRAIRNFGKDNPNYRGSKDVPGRWLSRAKSNAAVRNFDFKITLEDMQNQWEKQKGLCFYTGIPLQFTKHERTPGDNFVHISVIASLDRIDSSKGYHKNNIVWTSKTVNKIKMNLPHNLFVKACEMVYVYSNRGKI